MLIAVEGPSAVGKTTALQTLPPGQVLGEGWEIVGIARADMPTDASSREAQQFLMGVSARRWEQLLRREADCGHAYADTDPLKLHYGFATVAVGARPREDYEWSFRCAREAMVAGKLGFVDRVVLLTAPAEVLATRREQDRQETGRRRGNFPLHQRLGPPLEAYYAVLERLRPGTIRVLGAEGDVRAAFAAELGRPPSRIAPRYDVRTLDQLKEELDQLLVPS